MFDFISETITNTLEKKFHTQQIVLKIEYFLLIILIIPQLFFLKGVNSIKIAISDSNYTNKGNCYLIDNKLKYSFDLYSYNQFMELDLSDQNLERKILLNFCEFKANMSRNFLKIQNSTNNSWYSYYYDKKLWYYDEEKKTLKLKWITNSKCRDEKFNFNRKNETVNFIINIKCMDINRDKSIISNDSNSYLNNLFNNSSQCVKELNFNSYLFCPEPPYIDLYKFYMDYCYIFGLIYIVFGLFMISYGNLFQSSIFYMNGILFSRMIILFLIDYLIEFIDSSKKNSSSSEWIYFIGESLIFFSGFLIGHYIKKFNTSKYLFLGSMTGHIIYYIIWLPFCYYITFKPLLFYFISNFVCFFLSGLISYKYFIHSKNFLIISCAIIGSYNAVKGVSYYIGGLLPDKFFLKMMEKAEYETVKESLYNGSTLIYLVFFLILVIFSITFQKFSPFLFDKMTDTKYPVNEFKKGNEKLVDN